MSLALIVALPFLGAMLPNLILRFGRTAAMLAALTVPLAGLLLLASHAPAVLQGGLVLTQIDWFPSLGLNANFRLDGLSLFFSGLILGMGLLVIPYSRYYLSDHNPLGQFYLYLLMFQGAMLGIVLSDNVLLLLIFWELTSLTSFLLIGYWKERSESRKGALMALVVTGGGGLCLIAGMLVLGQAAGSHDLTVILQRKAELWGSGQYHLALILILIGAFAKSAQFPFHFWLPHAMAAPTPVSAYLHSATMVKAGIYLMIRLWPVMSGTFEWFAILVGTGLFTLLLGAWVALWKDDLKAVLAYSTISHLGLITMMIGFGSEAALTVALFHILCHATFKAALFLSAGIIDHETGTRDLSELGGLRKLMPVTFVVMGLASLSMAGVPPLNGFLSKEMFLAETTQVIWPNNWVVAVLATCAAALSVAYAFRILAKTFLGKPGSPIAKAHDPGPGLWLAPAFLSVLVVLIGIAPNWSAAWLIDPAVSAASGRVTFINIAHWHGLKAAELWMSLAGLGGGIVLLGAYPRLRATRDILPKVRAADLFDAVVDPLAREARQVTETLHNGSFRWMLVMALGVVIAASSIAFFSADHQSGHLPGLELDPVMLAITVVMVLAALAAGYCHRNRLLALLLTGIVGLLIAPVFATFSAPDLALTQVAVEVVTILLMLQALHFLPKTSPSETPLLHRFLDLALAGLAGFGMAGLAYAMLTRSPAFESVSAFHLSQSKPGAGGTNAVNTIIVDFRGFDTFGEIIVLGIAALVLFALSEALLRSPAAAGRLARGDRPPLAGDRHPMLLVAAARLLLPMAFVFGIYLYLRGHNLPGGGFVAGLVFAIALLLQYVASGYEFSHSRQRRDHHVLVGGGVLVATLAGAGAWAFGLPFLTSGYTYVDWPLLETFELATAMIFDLGVFLCVLGAVLLALASLSRLAQAEGSALPANDERT
ncbi:MAG: monovalent cation/H+ antiporter subunit A [Tabrizicola sp.]|nr:monovalent cation/H+ antiporter subunit A [Tabrizicola sp.]